MRTLLTGLCILLLTACGSSPSTSYYLINSLPAADGVQAQTGPVIGMERVSLPGYLDATAILQHRSGQQLVVNESERWGEALPTAIPRVLSANLMALLPDHQVVRQPWSQQRQPDLRLIITVQELLAENDAVVLSANWQILREKVVISRQGTFRAPLGNRQASSIAQGHAVVLEAFARAIAADIQPGE